MNGYQTINSTPNNIDWGSLVTSHWETTNFSIESPTRAPDVVRVSSVTYEWRYVLPLYFVIFLLSVLGNSLVIATLAQNRRMRTVTNVYLLNLAVSDLLLGVFCLPFTIVGQVFRRFMFGAAMCKLIPYLQAVSVSVSVWTLVAISLERYFAICRPLKSRRWQTQGHAYKMIALVWIMSLLLDSPILYASNLLAMKGNAFKCREIWINMTMERVFNLGIDLALLVIPFTIMLFAYCLIVAKLWRGMQHEIQNHFNWQQQLERSMSCKSNRFQLTTTTPPQPSLPQPTVPLPTLPLPPLPAPIGPPLSRAIPECSNGNCNYKNIEHENNRKVVAETPCVYCRQIVGSKQHKHIIRSTHIDKSIEAKRKVIRMLFVIILEFFICWAPLHTINTIYLFYPEKLYNSIGAKGIALLQLIAYCSSCCNPITYCFMNRKFRQAFINLFRCCQSEKGCGCCSSHTYDDRRWRKKDATSHEQICSARGSHTARTGLECQEGEDRV